MEPCLIWKCEGHRSFVSSGNNEFKHVEGNPLNIFRDLLKQSAINLPEDLPQASAVIFGYFGYYMVRHIEILPNVNQDKIGLTDAMFIRPTKIAVLDGVKGEVFLVSPVFYNQKTSSNQAFIKAKNKIEDAIFKFKKQLITLIN